jgi:hypothetical protein
MVWGDECLESARIELMVPFPEKKKAPQSRVLSLLLD